MRKIRVLLLLFVFTALWFSCQPKQVKKSKPVSRPPAKAPAVAPLPETTTITAQSENVREAPNGTAFGKVHKGEKIHVMNRVGNWILFYNSRFDSVYVWGPSAGFEYIDVYSVYTYYDTSAQQFYPAGYFRKLFNTPGEVREKDSTGYQLTFKNLGLGSHRETVLEVVEESTRKVRHGVTLYINAAGKIYQVNIDFYEPVQGPQLALEKCDLPFEKPSHEDEGFLKWKPGKLVPGLAVELERQFWKSDEFSSIWYRKP